MKIFQLLETTNTIDDLKQYAGAGYYLHYNDMVKAGVNPSADYDTPLGVFAYPLDQMLPRFDKFDSASAVPFAGDRNYIMVLKPKGNFIHDITKYNDSNLQQDLAKLESLYGNKMKKESLEEYKEAVAELKDMKANGEDTEFQESMVDMLKDAVDNTWDEFIDRMPTRDYPFDTLYHITGHLTDENPSKWGTLFRKLGYDGFSEISDTGILQASQKSQAVFLSKSGFDIIDAIPNKDSRDKRLQKTLNKKKGEELPPSPELFYTDDNEVTDQPTKTLRGFS